MKVLIATALVAISLVAFAQEDPMKIENGYYSLSQFPSEKEAYLFVSGDSAVLNWIGDDGAFNFKFENLKEVSLNDEGYTLYQYAEPDGYNRYPFFVIKNSEDMEGTFDIEFAVFEKTFKIRIDGVNYYEYGNGKGVGTCCAPFKRFETLDELINRKD